MRLKFIYKKGFTLLDIIISMGISAIVGSLLLVIITNSAGIFYKESSKIQSGLNINDALLEIRESIKESSAIVGVYDSGITTYTSGATQLVLKVFSVDSTNNIIPNVFDYFVFLQDQNKLIFKTFPNAQSSRKAQDRIYSTIVNSLLFQYLNSATPPAEVAPVNATKIKITITLRQKSGANFETSIATSEANVRNN